MIAPLAFRVDGSCVLQYSIKKGIIKKALFCASVQRGHHNMPFLTLMRSSVRNIFASFHNFFGPGFESGADLEEFPKICNPLLFMDPPTVTGIILSPLLEILVKFLKVVFR